MTGDNYSKKSLSFRALARNLFKRSLTPFEMTRRMLGARNRQSGQALLIAVMLMAVLLTVVFSASFVSRTDTQISKLEEENQKALAAAEAGIEAALQSGTVADLSTLNVPAGFTGTATVSTTASPTFISPLVQRNKQYTFYLSTPGGTPDNPNFTTLTSSYNNQNLTVCSTSNSAAMALTLLKSTNQIRRFVINPPPPGTTIVTSGTTANGLGTCPSGQPFVYQHQLTNIGTDNLLLLVRLVSLSSGVGARIGLSGGGVILPLQGRTIVSTASSPTGVTKKIQLFQSYPQIPAEFFITSF